jgi:hypothetical protein
MSMVMSFRVQYKVGDILTIWSNVNVSRSTLLHSVTTEPRFNGLWPCLRVSDVTSPNQGEEWNNVVRSSFHLQSSKDVIVTREIMTAEQKFVVYHTTDRALGQHVTVGQCLKEELMSFEATRADRWCGG